MSEKITTKRYIAKYVFLKILFGEYKLYDFVPSESQMAEHFRTTNLTIRSAYAILLSNNILQSIKGKGYQVINDVISFIWKPYEVIKDKHSTIESGDDCLTINFYNDKDTLLLSSKWMIENQKFDLNQNSIETIKKIFQMRFNINNFLNFAIKDHYEIVGDKMVLTSKYLGANKEVILVVISEFNINDISLFIDEERNFKI